MAWVRSSLSKILLATQRTLIQHSVFDSEDVAFLSMRMNPPVVGLQADSYAILLPLSFFGDANWFAGAGRHGTAVRGRLNVYPRNRNAMDEAYKSDSWLTDPQMGILDQIGSIVDALGGALLEDEDGNSVLNEPLRLAFWGEPKQKYEIPDWGDCVVEFEAFFTMKMNTNRIA